MKDDEKERLESIVSALDQREIQKTRTKSYKDDDDGGIKSLMNKAYNSYISDLDTLEVGNATDARKVVDDYVESVFAAFEPESYERIKESLAACDEDERRNYLSHLIQSYMGTQVTQLQRQMEGAQREMTEKGDVGAGIELIDQLLKHPDYGVANQKAMSRLNKEISDMEGAEKMVNFVADNYLASHGYTIDDAHRKLIAADQEKATEFITGAVNGSMDPYFRQRYHITEM